MTREATGVFKFGEFELDERVLELRRHGRIVDLQPKPLLVLLYLIRHADRVVGHQELQEAIWPDVTVSEASLKTALYTVRRALGEKGADPHWIATVQRFGYRFRGKVEHQPDAPVLEAPSPRRDLDAALAFVDRETELRTLRAALRSARGGERRIVLLHGPPGIGKTRTALEIAREAESEGFEVHIGRVEEGGGAPAYWPWTQILRSLARARTVDGLQAMATGTAPDWVRLVPELSSAFSRSPEPSTLDSEQARFRLLDAVTQLLRDAAQTRPLLLVLDDLHWADEASLALLAFVARNLSRTPLLAIGTHRELDGSLDPGRTQALARIGRDINVDSVVLRGLERTSVVRILEDVLGSVNDELVERVERATGGNPFFVSEIARWLSEQGDGAFTARLPVPERLREAVLLRVTERSPACQTLLRAACVIGTRCSLPLLRRIVDMSVAELLAALSEAERADLIRHESPTGHYAFAHGVVREALYDRLADTDRMRLHVAVGEALEKLHAPNTTQLSSELAHHFCESAALSDPMRAIRYARAAAEGANASFAYEEAATHCQQALQVLEFVDAPALELRCDLLIQRSDALRAMAAPFEQTQEICAEAIRLARALDRPDLLARAATVAASDAHQRGGTLAVLESPSANPIRERYIEALEEALARLGPDADEIRPQAMLALAILHEDGGDRERATTLVSDVLRLAEQTGDPVLTAQALRQQLTLRFRLDGVEQQRWEGSERITELGRLTARPDFELFGYIIRGSTSLMRGDRTNLDAASVEMQRLATAVRIPVALALTHIVRSLCAQLDGRLDEAAREAFQTARVQVQFQSSPRLVATVLSLPLWWLALLRGQEAPILALMEPEAVRFSPMHIGHLLIARLQCSIGRSDEARRILERHDAPALAPLPRDDGWVFGASLAAEICVCLGERERAADLYELLLPYAALGTCVGWLVICTGSVARPLGSLAALLGRWSACDEHFERALAYADSLRSPVLRTWTELDYARALRGRTLSGVQAKRRKLIESVLERAQELGMHGAVASARKEADDAR